MALRKPAQARMADEGEQEQKPNVGAGPEHLNLQVKSQVGTIFISLLRRCIHASTPADLCGVDTLCPIPSTG